MFDPVLSLLLRCAREDAAADLLPVDVEEADWSRVATEAIGHGVAHDVLAALERRRADGQAIPEAVLADLLDYRDTAAGVSLFLANEQVRLDKQLEEHAIPVLWLKGAVLSEAMYGSIMARPFGDVDLLISPDRLDDVRALLTRKGYERERPEERGGHLRQWVHQQEVYVHPPLVNLDLHHRVMPPFFTYDAAFGELVERRRDVRVLGRALPAPSPEDLLLILCYHGLKNRWQRIKHLLDVRQVLSRVADLDWDAVFARAERSSALRVLHVGVHAACIHLGATIPPEVRRRVVADREAVQLAEAMIPVLLSYGMEPTVPLSLRSRLFLRSQDGTRGRARYVACTVIRRLLAIQD